MVKSIVGKRRSGKVFKKRKGLVVDEHLKHPPVAPILDKDDPHRWQEMSIQERV